MATINYRFLEPQLSKFKFNSLIIQLQQIFWKIVIISCLSLSKTNVEQSYFLMEIKHDLEKKIGKSDYLYIIRCLLLKYRLIFLRVLTVFDEPLGESNTERQVKISASISKEGT